MECRINISNIFPGPAYLERIQVLIWSARKSLAFKKNERLTFTWGKYPVVFRKRFSTKTTEKWRRWKDRQFYFFRFWLSLSLCLHKWWPSLLLSYWKPLVPCNFFYYRSYMVHSYTVQLFYPLSAWKFSDLQRNEAQEQCAGSINTPGKQCRYLA